MDEPVGVIAERLDLDAHEPRVRAEPDHPAADFHQRPELRAERLAESPDRAPHAKA